MSQNKKYKAIVFDYGGVLELNTQGSIIKPVAEYIGVSVEDFKTEYFKHNHLANVGNNSWNDMFLQVVSVFDDSDLTKEFVSKLSTERDRHSVVNTELVEKLPVLRDMGYSVAIFSNYSSKLRDILTANGIIDKVDHVVVSAEIGFQKPHKEAFEVLFSRLGVNPEEVIFIDDTPKSLETADSLGYTPVLFKNNEQLRLELSKLAIEI